MTKTSYVVRVLDMMVHRWSQEEGQGEYVCSKCGYDVGWWQNVEDVKAELPEHFPGIEFEQDEDGCLNYCRTEDENAWADENGEFIVDYVIVVEKLQTTPVIFDALPQEAARKETPEKFPKPKWMDEGEAKVIRDMLTAAEDRGYQVTVIDSIEGDGERVVSRSSDYAEAWANLFHTDSALLIFWDGAHNLGWVELIFSNGRPEEVISDHADRTEIWELMPREEECSY
tara:strand:- start:82 stop:765 length:684 start_codon:yes stop_codon:yes gene_type:complete